MSRTVAALWLLAVVVTLLLVEACGDMLTAVSRLPH